MSRGAALVTGASAGLGRAYARSLAERGHPLLLVARRADRLEEVAAFCRDRHAVPVRVLACDLATDDGLAACRAAMDEAPLEVAVLNAGFGSLGSLAGLDREREGRMVRLNCLAVTDLAAHALPGMLARGRGSLVVVSSAAAFQPVPYMATYAATKAFGLHLAEALAGEVAGSGVRVVAVCPGPTATEFSEVITREGARPGEGGGWPWILPIDDATSVVRATWRALEAGRPVAATGLVAHASRAAARVVPRGLLVAVAGLLHRHRTRRAAGDRAPI
ncbi:MAG: SDR family oxidoreductase [Thermoleophilia bacterium]|nr:SDR family oxidoreductase [Thermoleophilia bacterium]